MKPALSFLSFAAAAASALFFTACINDPSTNFDSVSPRITLSSGENRVMLRTRVRENVDGTIERDYTLRTTLVEKDTTFDGYTGRILSRTEWDLWADTVVARRSRSLVVQEGDSLFEYVFKASSGTFASDLFKATASLDTTAFSDRMLQMVSPLAPGGFWSVRDDGNPWRGLRLEKEYKGKEWLTFNDKRYSCGVFVLNAFMNVQVKTWVSSVGVMRGLVDYGSVTQIGASGMRETYSDMRDEYELKAVNATDAEIDGLKAQYKAVSLSPMPR